MSEMPELKSIVEELMILFNESASYHQERAPDVGEVLTNVRNELYSLRSRIEVAIKRYVVAVVGLTNVGKSTFLNALLGIDIAPQRIGPCTGVIVEFENSDECVNGNEFNVIVILPVV
jgi:ribosome biogenesis GTPase A